MLGIEYVAAFIKVCFNIAFSIVTAIPFYYSWNCIAPIYFGPIPDLYTKLPYWHIVAAFIVCTYVGEQIKKLFPTLVSVSQSNNNK